MKFDQDDLDWALGELLALFSRSNVYDIYPHELEPVLFYGAWALLNEQPFEVRQRWHSILVGSLKLPYPIPPTIRRKRYAYVLPY
jgi:hypothetical protein